MLKGRGLIAGMGWSRSNFEFMKEGERRCF